MANPFEPKRQYARVIDAALAEMANDADSVTITGMYGEKGVVFFTQDGDAQSGSDSPVGAFLFGKGITPKHFNIGHEAAADLVGLLVSQFGLTVRTERVPVTTYEEHVIVE